MMDKTMRMITECLALSAGAHANKGNVVTVSASSLDEALVR